MAAPAVLRALRRLCGVALFVSQLYVLSGRGERGVPGAARPGCGGLGGRRGRQCRAGPAEPQRGGCCDPGGRAGPRLLAGLTSDARPGLPEVKSCPLTPAGRAGFPGAAPRCCVWASVCRSSA